MSAACARRPFAESFRKEGPATDAPAPRTGNRMMAQSERSPGRRRRAAGALAAAAAGLMLAPAPAGAAEDCGICARSVLTNATLAACFLDQYSGLARRDAGLVAVDLSGCETPRGVVEALPEPTRAAEEPDLRFILSRGQLACLRQKLEAPDMPLDPLARIDLEGCP